MTFTVPKPSPKAYRFTMPPKCGFENLTIREMFGVDEDSAAIQAEIGGGSVEDAMVDLSIVKIDGNSVIPGAAEYDSLPSRIRRVIHRFYRQLNGIETAKLFPFIEEAEKSGVEIIDGKTVMTFKMPPGCEVKSISFREMMRDDEEAAAVLESPLAQSNEMIRRCVVKVDGESSELTIENWKRLKVSTQTIMNVFWSGMNLVPEEELSPLLEAATVETLTVAEEEEASSDNSAGRSSESGSGSPQHVHAV